MKRFLVLYRMDMGAMKKMMETSTPEQRKKGMEEWGAWMKNNAPLFADMGGPTGKNSEISPSGVTQKSNDIGGYSIVQAASLEEASAAFKSNPHFQMPGATIDIAEIVAMG